MCVAGVEWWCGGGESPCVVEAVSIGVETADADSVGFVDVEDQCRKGFGECREANSPTGSRARVGNSYSTCTNTRRTWG